MSARARKDRGYTMVEVIMGLALLGIGATGVIAMQKTTLISNNKARMLATATQIAGVWADRLQADASQWNNPNGIPDIADTRWVNQGIATPNVWFVPLTLAPVGSSQADVTGNDIFAPDTSAPAFCTHLRLTPMGATMMRAEIRVFWARNGEPVNCAIQPTWDNATFGAVYITTSVVQNTTQQ